MHPPCLVRHTTSWTMTLQVWYQKEVAQHCMWAVNGFKLNLDTEVSFSLQSTLTSLQISKVELVMNNHILDTCLVVPTSVAHNAQLMKFPFLAKKISDVISNCMMENDAVLFCIFRCGHSFLLKATPCSSNKGAFFTYCSFNCSSAIFSFVPFPISAQYYQP